MNNKRMRAMALVLTALSFGAAIPKYSAGRSVYAASTIAELEAKKEENNKKIAEYEIQLANFAESEKKEQAYQDALQEKIDVLQENMGILDNELSGIKEKLFYLEQDISDMEDTIQLQEVSIDKGLEEFKLRLRAMYVNGNDSLASALVGATDFYDLLSKYELISCVARHDEELVNGLRDELNSYHRNLTELEGQKTAEEAAQAEAEVKQAEMQDSMDDLNASYAESEAEKKRIQAEQDRTNKTIEELEAENKKADEDEQEIRDAIARAEEAARLKREQEEKQREEERKKKQQEEEEKKKQQQQQNNSSHDDEKDNEPQGGDDDDDDDDDSYEEEEPYTPPSYSDSTFAWPCPSCYYVTSTYGYRWGTLHKGIDIGASGGATVTASRGGTVITCSTSCTHNYGKSSNCCGSGYGNYVILSHGDGTYSTLYGHMQSVYVSIGDYVPQGGSIGAVGSTGYSTGNHLHFEIRKYGTPINPSEFLNY